DGANGTGIDAVWRANPANNGGEKFAIVEAKASRDEDAPKFMRKLNNTRKPGVASKLGVSGLSEPSELIEPVESSEGASPATNKTRVSTGKHKTTTGRSEIPSQTQKRKILVQMSREWIEENLGKSVGVTIAYQVPNSYSRHLFYTPLYHTSMSPKEHAAARLNNSDDTSHLNHKAFHYGEKEVKAFVNKRKKSLAKKHGALSSLKIEA
ncbi:hypothetical protein GXB78_27660, partial [Pseudomonas moraviensis subsp. stanleyae]|nr:hypothetical protein [Pseudomonas moraviensis subsp. stanleyae]